MRATLNCVTDVYEVGQFYRVPCVHGRYFRHEADWPVIGPQHEDAEFVGFEFQHYHIDWRFVSKQQFSNLGWNFGAPLMTSKQINVNGLPKPVMRRRKMQRAMQDFSEARWRAKWFPKMEAAYAGCKLKPGLICPHRGIPLAGQFQDGVKLSIRQISAKEGIPTRSVYRWLEDGLPFYDLIGGIRVEESDLTAYLGRKKKCLSGRTRPGDTTLPSSEGEAAFIESASQQATWRDAKRKEAELIQRFKLPLREGS
jgi:hypothetical protein